jgi:DNA-binding NarL/FixJ family response regulator
MTPWTNAKNVRPHGKTRTKWEQVVNGKLKDGWGTEDIALWLECDVRWVQHHVSVLRQRGALAKFYGRPNA